MVSRIDRICVLWSLQSRGRDREGGEREKTELKQT